MATTHDWAEAYLVQAREDLAGARELVGKVPSVLAMLLQMTFEKMAKAALLRSGHLSVAKATVSHAAASRMIELIKRNRSMLRALGKGYEHAWKDILPIVVELERAHPGLAAGRPQLEYPWEDSTTGEIRCPKCDLPVALRLSDPNSQVGPRVLRFAAQLSQQFDAIFPS